MKTLARNFRRMCRPLEDTRKVTRLNQRHPLREVVAIEGIVVMIEAELAFNSQRHGITRADVGRLEQLRPLTVVRCLIPILRAGSQKVNCGENKDAERRHPLLAIDDLEALPVLGLENDRAHVVVGTLLLEPAEVLPQVFPMLLLPGIVTLVTRNGVGLAVTEKLLQVLGSRDQQIGLAHEFRLEV